MTTLSVKKKNEVYVTIQSAEPHVHHELSDYFSFEVPEAKFLKKNPDTNTGMERSDCILLAQVNCMVV